LIADGIGKIHHLKVEDDTLLSLFPVKFSKESESFLDTFSKAEIAYDKFSGVFIYQLKEILLIRKIHLYL